MYLKDLVILCFIASHLYYCNFLIYSAISQRRGQTQCVLDGNQGLPKCFWQIVRQLKRRKQYYTQMVHSAGGSCKLQLST